MKIQDLGFLFVFILLFFFRKPRLFIISGLFCYVMAIPLFALWVFFTAERFTWYGTVFLLFGLVIPKWRKGTVK